MPWSPATVEAKKSTEEQIPGTAENRTPLLPLSYVLTMFAILRNMLDIKELVEKICSSVARLTSFDSRNCQCFSIFSTFQKINMC